jgi:transposase
MPATQVAGIAFMAFVRGVDRSQSSLFPVSLDELVPAEHVCRVIEAFVERLSMAGLGFGKAQPKATGRPPYDPADLLKLYLYGYLHQLRSSRRLERECQRNVEVMWLLNRLAPDHKTIAQFRRDNGAALKRAGAHFVRFCQAMGLVRGEWVAIDGSKFQAVASGKAVLRADELRAQQARLEQRIDGYLQALDAADASDGEAGVDTAAVRQALALLADEQAALAALADGLAEAGRSHRVLTEPEARCMKGHGPAYNVQTAVDGAHALIVAHAVTAEASDNRCLQPMAEAARDALQVDALDVLADAGYSNGAQATALEAQGIMPHVPANRAVNNHGDGRLFDRSAFAFDADADAFTCPAGQPLTRKQLSRKDAAVIYQASPAACAGCALKPGCTQGERRFVSRHLHEQALARMQARATPEAMRRRRCTVEHPFASLKYRIFEKPRFLLRGIAGAASEMAIATLSWNIKRAMNVLGTAALQRALAASRA